MRSLTKFPLAALLLVLSGGCGTVATERASLPPAQPVAAQTATPAAQPTTPAPTLPPAPAATPTQSTPEPAPPQAQPAAAAPPVASTSTFPLGGNGSVAVTTNGGSATITVTVSGLNLVAHAVHLHAGCNGSPTVHIASIGIVGSAGTVSLTLPARFLGVTVIVYPNAAAVGRPILCGATS